MEQFITFILPGFLWNEYPLHLGNEYFRHLFYHLQFTILPNEIISQTIAFVKCQLKNAEAGHDWWHIQRVQQNANNILKTEPGADPLVVELAALLHDIADAKFHDGNEEIGPQTAVGFLHSIGVKEHLIFQTEYIIRNISFKGGIADEKEKSLELKIVQDADRLDALGAIGIARAFHYGGYKNREMYNPAILPQQYANASAYHKSTAPTVNHFYEKLLLLKEKMNTKTGKRLAEERHRFLEIYLDQFFAEWRGEK